MIRIEVFVDDRSADDCHEKLANAEACLREIDRILYVQGPPVVRAEYHFMQDLDLIRDLTKPWHV